MIDLTPHIDSLPQESASKLWPKIDLDETRSAKAAAAKKRERDRIRKAREYNEVRKARLLPMRDVNYAYQVGSRKKQDLLRQIDGFLQSESFSAWLEATAGLSPADLIRQFQGSQSDDGLAAFVVRVQLLADRNKWRNPESRALWASEIGKCKSARQRRYVLLRLATPSWVSAAEILEIHAERARVTIQTGIPHHVDHIIPIVSNDVCGLNVPANLRIIPAIENAKKGNRLTI